MPMKRHHGVSYFWNSTLTIAANRGATLAIVVRTIQPVVLWLLCHRTRGLDVESKALALLVAFVMDLRDSIGDTSRSPPID